MSHILIFFMFMSGHALSQEKIDYSECKYQVDKWYKDLIDNSGQLISPKELNQADHEEPGPSGTTKRIKLSVPNSGNWFYIWQNSKGEVIRIARKSIRYGVTNFNLIPPLTGIVLESTETLYFDIKNNKCTVSSEWIEERVEGMPRVGTKFNRNLCIRLKKYFARPENMFLLKADLENGAPQKIEDEAAHIVWSFIADDEKENSDRGSWKIETKNDDPIKVTRKADDLMKKDIMYEGLDFFSIEFDISSWYRESHIQCARHLYTDCKEYLGEENFKALPTEIGAEKSAATTKESDSKPK